MVESAIVLGVFAIIVAGIWLLLGSVYQKAREHNASLQIQTIVRNVRTLYGRVGELGGSAGDYTLNFDQQNIFPRDMKVTNTADGKINHPWSTSGAGTVQVMAGFNDPNGEATQFDLHYIALSKKACTALATTIPNGQITGLVHVQVNGNQCYSSDGSCSKSLPMDIVTTAAECNKNDNASGLGQNDVLFRINIH